MQLGNQPAYGAMSTRSLAALVRDNEVLLARIGAERALLKRVKAEAEADRRRQGLKLTVNGVVGVIGIVSAPVTLGWSLGLTVVSVAMLIWDTADFIRNEEKIADCIHHEARCRNAIYDIRRELSSIEREVNAPLGQQPAGVR